MSVCVYVCASMIPTHRCSSLVPSSMSIDLNDGDQNYQACSSSSSLPYPHHDPTPNQSHTDHEDVTDAEKNIIPSGRSWKREDRVDKIDEGLAKWMPSKMRMMRKMIVADQTMGKFEDHQKQPLLSSPETDHNNSCYSSCSNHNNMISIRVCADCHTTKTPLWRSGPTGPKSLCNACGIRQRKARRAMAATAVAPVRENKIHNKQKKPQTQLKKKRKLGVEKPCGGRKKLVLEDFAISLSKSLSVQQVFPQDEKEAAILLMALSYGLVRG